MLGDEIFAALSAVPSLAYGGKVAVHPDTFPQEPSVPRVPAVRYTLVGGTVYPSLCGNELLSTADPRYQFDVIHSTPALREALVDLVIAALDAMTPIGTLQEVPFTQFDQETKRFRSTFDYVFQPSSASP
jgi:hypothetical protein